MADQHPQNSNFPLSNQFTINYSALEDRLVVRAQLAGADTDVHMLLSRRMVMVVMRQLVDRLPALTGLEKTPSVYWQEVLRMGHQQAMQAKAEADKAAQKAKSDVPEGAGKMPENGSADSGKTAGQSDSDTSQPSLRGKLYLATELTVQLRGEKNQQQLLLAFKGLPMPDAMIERRQHLPVFAIPLKADNVHQLIELIISKCDEAHWHLPLDLPWLADNAEADLDGVRRDN